MREDMIRSPSIPSTLPPPYTTTGSRSNSLRTNPKHFCSTAELLVGSKRARFLIHTKLLVEQSPYFRAALTGSFLEGNSKTIELDDVSVDVFEICVGWLYTGSIHPAPFKDGKPAYYALLHLYILADRLCFEGLRNAIIDMISELADTTNSVLTPSDTRILYEQIMPESPIRKLVLDLFAFKKTDKLINEHEDRWHAEFLRDLCVHLKKPCEQALRRHQLRMWIPESWHATRACDHCRCILPPRYGAVGCDECGLAWCIRCVGEGVALASWEDGRTLPGAVGIGSSGDNRMSLQFDATITWADGTVERREGSGMAKMPSGKRGSRRWESCKPWRGARCGVYHEHKETDNCGDLFMGR